MALLEIAVILTLAAVGFYVWVQWKFSYWKRRGIKQLQPSLPYGNLEGAIRKTESYGFVFDDIYRAAESEPAIGIYKFTSPVIVIRDAQLVKDVLIKEFSSIHDNDLDWIPSTDPVFSNNPFCLTGDKWKDIRRISSTGLTPNRVKKLVDDMKTACNDIRDYLIKENETVQDAKKLGGFFTSDVVSGSVFGITSNSFKDPDSKMRKNIVNSLDFEASSTVFQVASYAPILAKYLNLRLFPKNVEKFFLQVVQDSIEYRKKNSLQRDDFLQHLMSINEKENGHMTVHQLMAHCMTFVVDGYETSSVAISHICDQLSLHPDVQVKLREEINSQVKSMDDLTFDLIHSLRYLDAVVNETLRMRPPGTVLRKIVTRDVTLSAEGKTYELEKGNSIVLPIYSIQKDPKYFEFPEEFRPERFLDNPNPEGFFPFGLGPRQCLGYKFALTQVKACVISMVKHFEIIPKDPNPGPFEAEAKTFTLLYKKGGVWVKFRHIK